MSKQSQQDDIQVLAKRRLVATLAKHFKEGWSREQIRAAYPDHIAITVDGEQINFPATMLDDIFLNKVYTLYQMIDSGQTQ